MQIYALYAVIGIMCYCGWTYFAVNEISFAKLAMTMSTLWGLFQISFLMGYGLVLLPMSFRQREPQQLLDQELCLID